MRNASAGAGSTGTGTLREDVAALLRLRLRQWIREAAGEFAPDRPAGAGARESVLDDCAVDDLAAEVVGLLGLVDSQRSPLVASTAALSLADVLQMLGARDRTGVLTIRSRQYTVDLHLLCSRIEFINPRRGRADALNGVFYFRGQAIEAACFEAPPGAALDGRESVFFRIAEERVVEPADLPDLAREYGMELLRRCMLEDEELWFTLELATELPPRFAPFALKIPLQRFLLRLHAMVDELRVCATAVPPDGVFARDCLDSDPLLGKLTTEDLQLVRALDGQATVRSLCETCRENLTTISLRLYKLRKLQLITQVTSPEGTPEISWGA